MLVQILQFGNEYTKNKTTIEAKDYYDTENFNTKEIVKISRGITKQDELFDYVDTPSYLKAKIKTDVILTNVISTSGQKESDVVTVKIEGDLP